MDNFYRKYKRFVKEIIDVLPLFRFGGHCCVDFSTVIKADWTFQLYRMVLGESYLLPLTYAVVLSKWHQGYRLEKRNIVVVIKH